MKHLPAFVFASFIFFGCTVDETTMATNPTTPVLTIYPSDNQTDVTQTTPITLSFNKAVDKSVVEANFRLMNERSYMDSLCPVSKTMEHGSMTMSMLDSVKMNHLDSIHGLNGTFVWNSDGTSCSFIPDTLLYPGMHHMVHLREGMIKMMESTMGSMGMMGRTGMGSGMGMTFHFTTVSTTLGGGHDSHHP
ncbi:MAG: Ig-like domain-containing domain [Bacteroidota bacterium]